MKIAILGTGNIATVLGKKLLDAGHQLIQVYGRNPLAAGTLAYELGTRAVSDIRDISTEAELYLLAVSDKAVPGVAAQLQLPGKLVAHTAGAVSIKALEPAGGRPGVLYPLQSLHSSLQEIPHIPLAVDGDTEETKETLAALGRTISSEVFVANDEQRAHLHLAAVMVNNFTNHLYALADRYCQQAGVDFTHLLPLVRQTAERLHQMPAKDLQTGPARRGDADTLQKHLHMLQHDPALRSLYESLTQSIQQLHTPGE